ncbi:MAG: hypothetical protein BM563_05950 [Bacteroidetes bacterium MedPE-SWsnd-G1]|nr:MAG: hypothetical protein BM563_05950 [Bacteroidetes bacterium MedPE-SWsnd-G1]
MKEELLHFIWKHKLFYTSSMKTVSGKPISVVSVGTHNLHTGPDFLNARIRIDDQLWAGNIEIHVNASDWYVHGHENDSNYDALILHVVWNNDVAVFDKANNVLPTIELNKIVSKELLNNYQKLFSKSKSFINCEKSLDLLDDFTINNWLERLYIERIERKALEVNKLLNKSEFNWEQVLFQLLAKNFGLKVNAEPFFKMADALDFAIVRKESQSLTRLESLFFGQLGLLNEIVENDYYLNLKKEYEYQVKKYKLGLPITKVQYFRLRPTNFPTIRAAQLANLFFEKKQLFADVMKLNSLSDFYTYFKVATSKYWETHYTFETDSKKSNKNLTKSFVDLLLINTIIPLRFVYFKHVGKFEPVPFLRLIQEVKPEKNSIINNFKILSFPTSSAFETQALLELKNNYCAPQKCLQCAIGLKLLRN